MDLIPNGNFVQQLSNQSNNNITKIKIDYLKLITDSTNKLKYEKKKMDEDFLVKMVPLQLAKDLFQNNSTMLLISLGKYYGENADDSFKTRVLNQLIFICDRKGFTLDVIGDIAAIRYVEVEEKIMELNKLIDDIGVV